MIYVVDASVAVKWYIPEIYEREAALILSENHELHVPELILPEFANIIWKKLRRKELNENDAKEVIEAMSSLSWKVHSHETVLHSAFTGATVSGQTVYDWTYLALAVSLDCQFVTADERFYKAIAPSDLKRNLLWIGDVS